MKCPTFTNPSPGFAALWTATKNWYSPQGPAVRPRLSSYGVATHRVVFRAAYRIVKNREDAEDLAQETFLKAFAHLQSFNGAAKFSTWLVRIGINAALGELRRRRSRPEASFDNLSNGDSQWHWEIQDKAIDTEADLLRSEMIDWMNRSIDRLNPTLRTVVEMQQKHDYSHLEIALLANLSVPAVKSRLSRARRALRERYV